MSTYSQQIDLVLQNRLIPEMNKLAMNIAAIEPYSYTGQLIEGYKRKLNYYSLLYDFLVEYSSGSEEIDDNSLVNIVRLLDVPGFELRYPARVIPTPPQNTYFDIDENEYHSVIIGSQEWLVENLKTTTYADGTPIPNFTNNGFTDWFLPADDELEAMRVNLHLEGVGNFDNVTYWSSSEGAANVGWGKDFLDGDPVFNLKSNTFNVRACRSFVGNPGDYELRDIGPAGGLIFASIDPPGGIVYFEAAPSDQSTSQAWSNVTGISVGTTGTAIGTGQANTIAIIGQVGHTDSAAKLCDDITSDMLWVQDTTGAYCWYNDDTANKIPYGALYNWYAVDNAHGLAVDQFTDGVNPSTGWRVPSDTDFDILIAFAGGDTVAGGKLKEQGITHFNPNTGATDDYGFKAVGAGAREYGGQVFSALNSLCYFRTSTGTNGSVGSIQISGTQIKTEKYPYNEGKIGGSVRCMRDAV